MPVTLIDTAGMRATTDPLEREGVNRARNWAERADLVLEVVDEVEARRSGPAFPASLLVEEQD